MSDDLDFDLPLTSAQAATGHEVTLTVCRRVRTGTQWELLPLQVPLRVPAGVAPRTVLRLPGMGHVRPDGSSGDLRVRVLIDEAAQTHELRLSPADAARGTQRTVHLAGGSVSVTVPAGVSDGQVLKVSELFLRLCVDPLLPQSPAPSRERRRRAGGGDRSSRVARASRLKLSAARCAAARSACPRLRQPRGRRDSFPRGRTAAGCRAGSSNRRTRACGPGPPARARCR